MTTITPIIEKIRPLIEPLTAEERLSLIEAIAKIGPALTSDEKSSSAYRQQIMAEQASWFARSRAERQQYQGEYVALKDQQVIDHDFNQRALYLRVKTKHGRDPVAILFADWETPPTYSIHSPRLEKRPVRR